MEASYRLIGKDSP